MLVDDIIAEITKHPKLREALQEMDDVRREIGIGKSISSASTFTASMRDENGVPVRIEITVGYDAPDDD